MASSTGHPRGMLFTAALLVAVRGDFIAASEATACEDAGMETEAAALFQSAVKSSVATLVQEEPWNGAGALSKDALDMEATLQEDDYDAPSSECHEDQSELRMKKEEQPQMDLSLHGLSDYLSLFQDMVWFLIAFAAFCIWRSFTDMEKVAEKLVKESQVAEKSVDEVPIRRNASDTPVKVDALVQAMYSDNIDNLRKLLDERSVNACDDVCCCTALHMAGHLGCLPAAEALLARGADVNVRDVWDETPLHFAARAGNVEVCDILLKNGADVNACNADGHTPLLAAAAAKKSDTCELLLDNGAHTGGAEEEDVPPLLNDILMRRILSAM